MSWILRNKKISINLTLIIIAIIFVFLRCYVFSVLCLILVLLLTWNFYVVNKVQVPLKWLWANRPVNQIDTLIIGNLCNKQVVKKICDLNHTLIITAPNRSLIASQMILYHVESILKENGTVVLSLPNKPNDKITWYDIPYLNKVTLLENGLNGTTSNESILPVIYHMKDSIKFLLGYRSSRLNSASITDEKILKLCKRKRFKLIIIS